MKACILVLLGILLAARTTPAGADDGRAAAILAEITQLRTEQSQSIEKMAINLSLRDKAEDDLAKLAPAWQALEAEAQQLDAEGGAVVSRWSCTQTGQGTYTCPCDGRADCLADVDRVNAMVARVKSGQGTLQGKTEQAKAERQQAADAYKALSVRQQEIARRIATLEAVRRAIGSAEQREACAVECARAATHEARAQCLLKCTAGARGPAGLGTVEETLPRVGEARPFGTGGRPTATEEAIREFTSKPRPGPRSFKMKEPPPPAPPPVRVPQQ